MCWGGRGGSVAGWLGGCVGQRGRVAVGSGGVVGCARGSAVVYTLLVRGVVLGFVGDRRRDVGAAGGTDADIVA